MNSTLKTVVGCPITSSLHPEWPHRIPIKVRRTPSEIAVDQIRAYSKLRIQDEICRLTNDDAMRLRLLITEMYGQMR
jgi:mRNA interferase MazF